MRGRARLSGYVKKYIEEGHMKTGNKSSYLGKDKLTLKSLPQAKERISFLYLERCMLNRQDNSISVTDARGTVYIPSALLSVLLLGPGTRLTHRAMELIGDSGVTVVWVGEYGVRYYAHGRPLTHSSKMLTTQAKLVSNTRTRLDVARKMYSMRFPGEDISKMSMQQLRGREGARVRTAYRTASRRTGVEWNGREYDPDDYESGNTVNKALSAAHTCLYGVAHSVIVALGCSPGLGFVHMGHERSFVYDIADLYKVELTVQIAFDIAAKYTDNDDIGALTRRAVRDAIRDGGILTRVVEDICYLFNYSGVEDTIETNVIHLWDEKNGFVKNAVSYGRELDVDNNDSETTFFGIAPDDDLYSDNEDGSGVIVNDD